MKKKRILKILLTIFVVSFTVVFTAGVCVLVDGYFLYAEALEETSLAERVEQIRSDPDYVSYDEISPYLCDAVVAVEDHRFYEHGGVDIIATCRAVLQNIRSGAFVEGGSTITQQLAKNMYFTFEKKISRKVAEMFMAVQLEQAYSKEEILALYLNVINFGGGYIGVTRASEGYFGVLPEDLSLPQATLLAGVPQSPVAFTLTKNLEGALERREDVLFAMVRQGYLTEEEADAVRAEPIVLLKKAG